MSVWVGISVSEGCQLYCPSRDVLKWAPALHPAGLQSPHSGWGQLVVSWREVWISSTSMALQNEGTVAASLQWAVDIRSNWRRAQELELLCAVATVIPATRNPRNQSAQFQRESFLETHQIGKEASKIRNKSLWYEHRWELTAKWYNIDNIDHNWFNKHVRPISLEITNLQIVNINRLLLLYGDRRLNINKISISHHINLKSYTFSIHWNTIFPALNCKRSREWSNDPAKMN